MCVSHLWTAAEHICPHLEVVREWALPHKVSGTLRVFLCQWRKGITDRIRQVSCSCCPETWACSNTHMPVPHSRLCASVCVWGAVRTCVTVCACSVYVCVHAIWNKEYGWHVCLYEFVTNSKCRKNDTKPPGNLHIFSTVIHSLRGKLLW